MLLELVVHDYESGATPQQIAERFDTLELADVHALIAYYQWSVAGWVAGPMGRPVGQ